MSAPAGPGGRRWRVGLVAVPPGAARHRTTVHITNLSAPRAHVSMLSSSSVSSGQRPSRARTAAGLTGTAGKRARCGSTDRLEFDHIDPWTKSFSLGSDWTRAWDDLVAEAAKMQLLCRPCHVDKTAEDRGEPAHGMHRYLNWRGRCDVCRAANAAASARMRAKKLASRALTAQTVPSDPSRSGVAQSAEHPAVNRVVESSSLSPRAERLGKAWIILLDPSTTPASRQPVCLGCDA